jgi:signal peptidase II
MQFIFMALFAAAIVAADQLSKSWVVRHIASSVCNPQVADCQVHIETLQKVYGVTQEQLSALPKSLPGIDGIFELSHVHNTGAAFSSFAGQRWLFAVIFLLFAAAIVWEFSKKRLGFSAFERWCIVAVFAGGLGNMIDRMRLGFVVDMINVEFTLPWLSWLNGFAIFNVADCFITCGCIAIMISLVFFNKTFWKDSKKK